MTCDTDAASEVAVPIFIAGLLLFLGSHSSRVFLEGWRARTIARVGETSWKGGYSLVSLLGLVLLVYGYGLIRYDTAQLWVPPVWTRHLAILLMLAAFILIASTYAPGSRIRRAVKHPMVLSVALWGAAHLLANGTLAALLLFGSFLAWAVIDYLAALRRPSRTPAGAVHAVPILRSDVASVIIAGLLWAAFVAFLHQWLFGVSPIG